MTSRQSICSAEHPDLKSLYIIQVIYALATWMHAQLIKEEIVIASQFWPRTLRLAENVFLVQDSIPREKVIFLRCKSLINSFDS